MVGLFAVDATLEDPVDGSTAAGHGGDCRILGHRIAMFRGRSL